MVTTLESPTRFVGAREWIGLPEFGIACIQARLDADGDESKLGTLNVSIYEEDGACRARFFVQPIAGDDRTIIVADALLAEPRGADGWRREPVIRTLITLGEETWPIDLRLVPQVPKQVRLSLGREALSGRFAVQGRKSFLVGPPSPG